MVATDKVFAGSIPETIRSVPGPADLRALRARPCRPDRRASSRGDVLETAAGTGVLTRAHGGAAAPQTRIVATDLNQPMLDRAAARQLQIGRLIAWQQADALALPFEDRAFDVVACQFGAMFFPDKVQGYREARRVLKPGGRFFFNVWDRIEDNEFADVVTQALAAMFPDDPPRFMARTPHGYHDVEQNPRAS